MSPDRAYAGATSRWRVCLGCIAQYLLMSSEPARRPPVSTRKTTRRRRHAQSRFHTLSELRFFVLTQRIGANPYETSFVPDEGARYGEAPRCPACGEYVGMREWLPPYEVELELHGDDWGDVAYFGADMLVSCRFADAWKRARLVGLEVLDQVRVVKPRRADVPEYLRTAVSVSEAAVDEARSRIVRGRQPTCRLCRSGGIDAIRGLVVEKETWSGEDVFEARGLQGLVIASDRFRAFAEDEGLTNIGLVPLNAYVWDPLNLIRE
jgi:hypothetical protein